LFLGPGGFSEYILFRKSWEAKGFGFTLRGQNDFKLEKFTAGFPESFDPYYGVKDNGDIYDKENQDSFADYIFKHSENGVHFVMADGGFSVEGQENIQEILSKQLYLCQCLTALKILCENGSFVCKFFDLFTPFSVGLIYLMYKCFDVISIIKPNSSRPANSERYLVCKWKKANTSVICSYLDYVNSFINESRGDDVIEIVNLDLITNDCEFFNYITASNNNIGRNQIIGLKKILAYYQNPQLRESRQSEIRKQCLGLWKLPDKLRQAPEVKSPEKIFEELLGNWYEDKVLLSSIPVDLYSIETLHKNIDSIYDWYFVPIGRGETNLNSCSIFLSKSRGNLLRYTDNKKWEPIEYIFEISPKSLFYGEIVFEYNGEGRTQTRACGLHIIDAIILGGKDIRRLKLSDRIKMCQKFSLSLNKPYKDGNIGFIRSKPLYKLEKINQFFDEMLHYTLKDNSQRLGYALNDKKFFVPGGILFFSEVCHLFFSKMSSSRNMLYYFNKTDNKSYYMDSMPSALKNTLYASFRNSFIRRMLWKWTNITQVEKHGIQTDSNLLYRRDIYNFVYNKQDSVIIN
ncbi:cap-specific mRNA (nucleoside-2'-O-)-methyltransferase 1-like, partial [Teleopsis dalmanni]|uniref:cap-specific mRNA (nucleoside-2'-O-)-methyltransferase 1-like n=1 Tax=Teleopsis dalmanni TaxID=139649 RepID=UPI0018CFB495